MELTRRRRRRLKTKQKQNKNKIKKLRKEGIKNGIFKN